MKFSLTSPTTAIPGGKFTCTGTVIGAGRVVMVDFFGEDTHLSQVWTISGSGGAWSVTLDSGSKKDAGYSIAFYDMTEDGAPGDMQFWQVDFGTNVRNGP